MAGKAALSILLIAATAAAAQSSSPPAETFNNQYVRMTILPGWTASASIPELKVTHGKYVLTINPMYQHASGVEGGRFEEVTDGMSSIEAVRAEVVQPSWILCAKSDVTVITEMLSLANLYTDDTKENLENGCKFPADGKPAWFGSYFAGTGSESEYTITLAYDTSDVNQLPKKDDPKLQKVLDDVVAMLKTLQLKPPILLSSIEPKSASPGATITLHGSGFYLPGAGFAPRFVTLRDLTIAPPQVSPDGKSMTFKIPASMTMISCDPSGYVDINGYCVPAPPNNTVVPCPPVNDRHPTVCGVPIPPGRYELQVSGGMVNSNTVSLDILGPKTTSVFVSMMYPIAVLPGDTIRVLGRGFTPTGNTVKIGAAVVSDVPSPDGKTLSFEAPLPQGDSLIPGLYRLEASVENTNGTSNAIVLSYPVTDNANPISLRWRPGGWAYRPQQPTPGQPNPVPQAQPSSQH